MKKSTMAVIAVIIVIVLSLGIYFTFFFKTSPINMDSFAKCISEKGATMYGAYWCTHCQNRKAAFGSSLQYVNYVECDPNGENANPQACQAAGVTSYPTWIINGTKYEGEQSLAKLASLTGCSAP